MKLYVIIILFTLAALPCRALAEYSARGDGKLALFSYHLGEYAEIQYRNEKGYDKEGLAKIDEIMRSRDGKKHRIELRLIELIDEIQDHFGADTIELISCYRSPEINRSIIASGRKAAGESLHVRGKACDIHIDEIDESSIYEYAKNRRLGGAGFYPRHGFVHIDVGPIRHWEEPPWSERVLVGSENNPNQNWIAVTDKDTYHPGEKISISIFNNSYESRRLSIKNSWLEGFRKGDWSEHEKIQHRISSKKLPSGGRSSGKVAIPECQLPGKYRLVIFVKNSKGEPPFYSNEFYIRKNSGMNNVEFGQR
ncbi:MAG: YcbK family protein [Myxococcales bacterium]|nr:YcbK family protein [Myxococcales bacterium]